MFLDKFSFPTVIFVVFLPGMLYNSGMKTLIDFHTHTIASGHHTTDTLTTLAEEAAKRGLKYLGVTDHAPKMPGAASESYFMNLKYCDKKLYGVKILYGAELNVLNKAGEVDLPSEILKTLDYSIASLHKDVIRPAGEKLDTEAVSNAMKNPFVSIIGHPDDPAFSVNFETLTDEAKKTGTILEFNAVGVSPEGYRKKNVGGLIEMLLLCKRKGVFVSLGSDSHGKKHIAEFENCYKVLKDISFPKELLLNDKPELFSELVAAKKSQKI